MYGSAFGSGCFYDTECLKNDPSRWENSRSWRWQKCYQLAYFQVAPTTKSLRSSLVDLKYHEQQCQAAFGAIVDPAKGVQQILAKFGGAHPQGHRIFFSNGGDDPWQRASVLQSLADDEVANLAQCDLCGHCGDLGDNTSTTPAPLVQQREEIIKYLSEWLADSQELGSDLAMLTTVASAEPFRSSPLVLVPIVFLFVALLVLLHVDVVRDVRSFRDREYNRLDSSP